MKIVIDDKIPYIEGRILGPHEIVRLSGAKIGKEEVKDADVLVVRTRTRCDESLLKGSKTKLVATATIGTDHIDVEWCEKEGIVVRNAPGCNAPGVAQYVLSSLLKAGFDPGKDTLGIIGYGNVGQVVDHWAQELGAKVIVSDPPRVEAGWKDREYHSKEEVLERSNAVTLHVPFTESGKHPTKNLITEKELRLIPYGGILINSSRGGVVKESDLKDTLHAGRLTAIIDVWEKEPVIDPGLASLAFISTPHIAGYSLEGKMRATRMVLEVLRDELGINVNLDGLECLPDKNAGITRELIEKSYDPMKDSICLKENLKDFEKLRNEYSYRHEPFFNV